MIQAGEEVYKFPPLMEGKVRERPNRFVVILDDNYMCHLHDPGRLKELLYKGNKVLFTNVGGDRKTKCQIEACWDNEWVITDSSIHNKIAKLFLPKDVKSEVNWGRSRIDFQYDNTLVEVKGASLVKNGVALFPDSPTERGRRHLEELLAAKKKGMEAKLMILVMRNAECFMPNEETDPKFASVFRETLKGGVKVEIKTFSLNDRSVIYTKDIQICHKLT